MTAYFAKYARAVAANGYSIVPIRPGSKAPLGLDWTDRGTNDPKTVDRWLEQGFEHDFWKDKKARVRGKRTWSVDSHGIGILTADTPAVDIDCLDETVSAHMTDFVMDLLGATLCRVGNAPKSLLVFRTDKPFAKVLSSRYLDQRGNKAQLEVLAGGQQFVALAIHPDTQKPYRWRDKHGPHDTPVSTLPTITVEQAREIRDEFDRVAHERGWSVVSEERALVSSARGDPDDLFADVAQKVVGVSDDELRRLTMLVPGVDDYKTWCDVGMALFHQFDGSEVGLEIWNDWSETGKTYDRAALEEKWPSFDIDGKGRQPMTARLILDRAHTVERALADEQIDDAIGRIAGARTTEALTKAAAMCKTIAFSALDRNRLAEELRLGYKKVTQHLMPIADARRLVAYEDPDRVGRFGWCDDWAYVQADDRFDNLVTGQSLSPRVFNASHAHLLLTRAEVMEGKTSPDHIPQDIALNVVRVPCVADRRYMPGLGSLFTVDDVPYVNSYSERGVPTAPERMSSVGRQAVERVEAHAVHLIPNDRDRDAFLDVLAYIVQTQRRVAYGTFLQGVGGDGKSFWGGLMAAVLGADNAKIIRGTDLVGTFTGWAEGALFLTVEEVRLSGEHRFEAVNNIKTFISNDRISIRRMQRDHYTIPNRTTYYLTSNYKDGLPDDETSRYLVLYSRWQSRDKLKAFKAANPSYYTDLFDAVREAGSIRRWLLDRRLSPSFDPLGRAPDTASTSEMQEVTVDDDRRAIQAALETDLQADFSPMLLDSSLLSDRLDVPPRGKRVKQLLNQMGLSYLGETGFGGKTRSWWSTDPEKFSVLRSDGKTKIDTDAIRKWLDDWL